jgi:hypothetical protein
MAGDREWSGARPQSHSWTSYIFLLPYGLFWLWVLVVAVLLIRRGTTGGPQRRTG